MNIGHPNPIREILRRAGMSVNSELTQAELSNAWKAVRLYQDKRPGEVSQNKIYTTIRPWLSI